MIVSNTTPISNFPHLNQVEILKEMFKKIHIPQAVKMEIDVFFNGNKSWQKCLQEDFIIIQKFKINLL